MIGSMRRSAAALAVAVASIGAIGVVAVATAAPSGAVTCGPTTDNWNGGSGSWSTAGDWSLGVPTSTSNVCIDATGTYTVDLSGSGSAASLQVGAGPSSGTQTLEVDGSTTSTSLSLYGPATVDVGGVINQFVSTNGFSMIEGGTGTPSLTIDSSGEWTTSGTSSNPAYIRVPVTNESGGTVSLGAPDTDQDNGTLTTNSGSFTVTAGTYDISSSGGFTQSAGTLVATGSMQFNSSGTFTASGGAESGGPVGFTGGTIADSAMTGAILVDGGSPTLTGTIPAGQTVTVSGSLSSTAVSLSGAVTDDGTLAQVPAANGYSMLEGTSTPSLTVGSGGTLSTSGTSNPAYIRVPVTNDTNGTVSLGATNTDQDNGTLTTNSGSFSVTAGTYDISSSGGFTQSAGTLVATGSMQFNSSGTFTASGGAESGGPVGFTGGTIADSAMTGAILVDGGSPTLTGTIPAGQTVTVSGSLSSTAVSLPSTLTVDGTLAQVPAANGYSLLEGAGSVTVGSGGTLSTSGTSNPAYIRVPVTNDTNGTVSLGATNTDQDNGTLTTNSGSFSVTAGTYDISSSGGFTQSAGTLVATGSMQFNSSGTFTASGGAESGGPVGFTGGTIADSAMTGAILVDGGSPTLTGTIPAGQTVTVSGSLSSTAVSLPSTLTVDGTLAQVPAANGYSLLEGAGSVTVGSGGTLSTSGTSNPAYIRVPITNHAGGTMTIGAPATDLDNGTATNNAGTLQVANGGELSLTSSSTLVNTGTLGVTVNGTAGTGGVTGAGITLTGSTLSVTTMGTPSVGTPFVPINGSGNVVTGAFSHFSFLPDDEYTVTYPTDEVEVTVANVFQTTPTGFTPPAGSAYGPVQVGSISGAGPGTYSGTVNYGDGTGNLPATVNVTGTTGTVTAPSHTYTSPGTYTVTMTVVNDNGGVLTAQTVTESVTTGPTITHLSKSSVAAGKKLSTTVSGIGFDGTGTKPGGFTTSDSAHITVTKVTYKKATKKKAATYKVKLAVAKGTAPETVTLTLTQTGGTDPGTATTTFSVT